MLAEVHCNCQTVTLKQGARGKERITTGITSCVHFKVVLARLMGRPTCLRSGPLGLALCGGPLVGPGRPSHLRVSVNTSPW